MTQITIPAQVVNGHLQHETSLPELEGQHVIATLTVVARNGVNEIDLEPPIGWEKWWSKLETFKNLENGWDSYRASVPSQNTLAQATIFLEEAAKSGTVPTRLAPSVVGGVGFTFKHENRKTYVEFRNTGSVHSLFSDGSGDPDVEKIDANRVSYANLLARITRYFHE